MLSGMDRVVGLSLTWCRSARDFFPPPLRFNLRSTLTSPCLVSSFVCISLNMQRGFLPTNTDLLHQESYDYRLQGTRCKLARIGNLLIYITEKSSGMTNSGMAGASGQNGVTRGQVFLLPPSRLRGVSVPCRRLQALTSW